MATITPTPPGISVQFTDTPSSRFADPSCENLFAVGFFDRGNVTQGAGVPAITREFGDVVSYSYAHQGLTTAVVESEAATTWAAARVLGPSPIKATATVSTLVVTAKTAGPWANGAAGGLSAQVTASGSDRKLTIFEDGEAVATTAFTQTVTDLTTDFTAGQSYVTVTGSTLPTAGSVTNLATGDDDRGDATPTEWATALALLDRRFGPGTLILPGVTDTDVQAEALAHCVTHNRIALLDLPAGVSKVDAQAHIADLQADVGVDAIQRGIWIASWGYATPVAGEAERLVPYSAIEAGVTSKLIRTSGVQTPAFGPQNAASTLVTPGRLYAEWSTADEQALYADGINTAKDSGRAVSLWGYKTGATDAINSDAWQQYVRMGLQFEGELLLEQFIGAPIDQATLASLAGSLDVLCSRFVEARALAGFQIDVDSVNDNDTAAARELHARLSIRHLYSADWVDLSISVSLSA